MKHSHLHIPNGSKDLLPLEYIKKKKTEEKIELTFKSFGYLGVESPTFEHISVFDDNGLFDSSKLYKLTDNDGCELSLRYDSTVQIQRIAATEYEGHDMPLRLYYFNNVYRNKESYQGKLREFPQAGIELIGEPSELAVAEVIAISVKCLVAAGLSDFKIEIGSVEFIKGIIDETNLCDEKKELLISNLINKNYVAVMDIINCANVSQNLRTIFKELPYLTGKLDILEKVRGLTNNKAALSGLLGLERLLNILDDYGVCDFVRFDLSMTGRLDYYTGIIFRGYTKGTGYSIVDGGRYDSLSAYFGGHYPSVGFAIETDNLLSVLDTEYEPDLKTLISFEEAGRKCAYETGCALREMGVNIENSFKQSTSSHVLNDNIKYAKQKGYGGVLHFIDSDSVQIIDLLNEQTNTVSINELLSLQMGSF